MGRTTPALLDEEDAATQDERLLAVLCHIGGLFTSFIMPLILWLAKKDESPYLGHHGKEALNFQLFLIVLLVVLTVAGGGVGVAYGMGGMSQLVLVVWILALCGISLLLTVYEIVLAILASVAAWRGRLFRYPFIVRVIR